MEVRTFEMEMGGDTLSIEVGRLAQQADASAVVRYGDTTVLVTATMSKEPREGIDFFPLLVDYEERMYAVGKIPGSYGRREGRPGEVAILSARMIDRPLRPLFPDGFRNDVQVVATILSADQAHFPDIPAMIGASAALTVSDIPFDGPIGGVRVGRVDGRFIINPDVEEGGKSDLSLVVAGTKDAVMMVEAGAKEVPEEEMLDAIMFGHEEIKRIVALQERMREALGREKVEVPLFQVDAEVERWVREHAAKPLIDAIKTPDKTAREDAVAGARDGTRGAYREMVGEELYAERKKSLSTVLDKIMKEEVRRLITEEEYRPDGRGLDEIRPISVDVGLLPRTHGSGLFQRGQTQVLTVCTLGLKSNEQRVDDLSEESTKRYIHHYNFPAYSVGEVRPQRSPGRREIGHGALAERALLAVIPGEEEFPYTIRLVSEVVSSNGSTSQASVCGSTLALMDAGVPIAAPVAGVAMGLVKHGDRFAVLTDIQGMEDALGDMDFKVAGTADGVTALQMDIKVGGVSRRILGQALEQARTGRLFILQKMLDVLPEPRNSLSTWAPRILTVQVPVDKIRDVIGPGGKMIRKIIEESGAQIDIEDDGRCLVASSDEEAGKNAVSMIEDLIKEIEVGESYDGVVKRVMNFGAFVEVLPGKEGLVHISELAPGRVGKVEDVVNVGDRVRVKATEIDHLGRINLSRKDALSKEDFDEEAKRFPTGPPSPSANGRGSGQDGERRRGGGAGAGGGERPRRGRGEPTRGVGGGETTRPRGGGETTRGGYRSGFRRDSR